MLLIGLTGYAGTGKDTVREILQTDHDFAGLAFADPIRYMIRSLLISNGFADNWVDERALKEAPITGLGVSYRHMAQTLGTEWGRNLADDFWLRIASAKLDELAARGWTVAVISDVRFVNEAEWVKAQGGVIWRIVRAAAEPVRPHASESEMANIQADATIYNNGSLGQLRRAVFDEVRALIAQAAHRQAVLP